MAPPNGPTLALNEDGLLPPGDYPMTIDELRRSILVAGPPDRLPTWDAQWRGLLVSRLSILAHQLWRVGISAIYVNGSFAEDKDHPNDIDGYFDCDVRYFASGQLQRELNRLDPFKVWTWDPASRRPAADSVKGLVPMWHHYRVELYPNFIGAYSGILDRHGNNLPFPAAFRLSRRSQRTKGIVNLVQ